MERKEIYKIIDEERDYQDLQWSGPEYVPDEEKSIFDFVCFMEYYLLKAKKITNESDKLKALAEIRKVCALGVRVMELYGCPHRNMNGKAD